MQSNGKLLKGLPEEIRVLAISLLLIAPAVPMAAACGALSWIAGTLFCRSIKSRSASVITDINLVVSGLLLAAGQPFGVLVFLQVLAGAVSTVILTTLIARLFYYYWIPVLLLPSLVTAWGLSGLSGTVLISDILGTVRWETWYASAAIMGLSAIISPIFAMMTMLGFGFCYGFNVSVLSQSLRGPTLSLLLQGMAFAFCSSILLMPSRRSFFWAGLGLCLFYVVNATSQSAAFASHQLLTFMSILNLAFALVIYGARIFSRPGAFFSWQFRPEHKLNDAITQWSRFRLGEARTGLPFSGSWKVSQGFDGPWTHRGAWRHGLDFVVIDGDGKTFRNMGFELSDYYAFGKDILAPTSGYIVAMSTQFPDNPIGSVNNIHKFGNYIIIRDAFGAHVLVAHLQKGSVPFDLYQYVEAGQVVGRCGNSGYSPEPHIHLHVQADALIGSPTIPFHITNFLVGNRFHFHRVPLLGEIVVRAKINDLMVRQLNFEVGEIFVIVRKDGDLTWTTRVESCLDPNRGTMYFSDGEAKLFHYRDAATFYFYRYEGPAASPLFDLMTALPRVPLIYGIDCEFQDLFPKVQWQTRFQRWLCYAKQMLFSEVEAVRTPFMMKNGNMEITNNSLSHGRLPNTSCVLDPIDGFAQFTVGERVYEVKGRREHFGSVGDYSSHGVVGENGRKVV